MFKQVLYIKGTEKQIIYIFKYHYLKPCVILIFRKIISLNHLLLAIVVIILWCKWNQLYIHIKGAEKQIIYIYIYSNIII